MKKISILCLTILLVSFITGCTLNINMTSSKENEKSPKNSQNQEVEENSIFVPAINQEEANVIYQAAEAKGMDTNTYTESSLIVPSAVRLNSEDEVVSYFNTVNDTVDYLALQPKDETLKQKLANTFITIADFLFYDGTIGGVTFSSLTDATKEKVLAIASMIDEKIEKYFPGYKKTIKDTATHLYSSASVKIKEALAKGKGFIQDHVDEEVYNQMVEDGSNLADGFKNAGSVIKDVIVKGKDKVKNWYENFKEKHKVEQ